jgi:ATP-dependent Clp endopeptidase proteolytic subunit ClpP
MDPKKLLADVRQRTDALQRGGSWYDIRNAEEGTTKATVRIYDEIGFWGITADQFARDLAAVTADEIEVQISSPGGDVFAGIAIYNALRAHPAQVTTRVDGIAASIASIIVQAGDERVMLSGSQMMVHEAWGLMIGTAAEMREFADLLDRQNDNAAGIYASRTGRTVDEMKALMADGDTWLSADEAVELGLADVVNDPTAKKADEQAKQQAAGTIAAAAAESDVIAAAVQKILDHLTTTTSPADEREAATPTTTEVAVNSAEAERLLASLTLKGAS